MKCTEFADRLNEVLDLRLPPGDDALLQAHADACGECRELLCAQESLLTGLGKLRRSTRVPELGPRVLADLGATSAKVELPSFPVERSPRNWFTILASAAVVLMAVGFGIWVANQRPEGRQANGTGSAGGKQTKNGLAVIKPGVNPSAPTPGSQAAPHQEAVALAPNPPRVSPPALPAMDQAMASIASHWPQAGHWPPVDSLNVQQVEHFAPSIRPIRESFEVALDALLKTLPGKKDTTRTTQPQALQAQDWLHIA